MCGIAGVISWDEKYRVTRETLQRMSAAVAHRGPDGEGFYLNHEQEVTEGRPQCGFAFRRLAILDPDPRAMQPFTIGNKTIVFNGEIYNFRELREELKQLRPEYAWRTTGDTEVLLLAYDAWGENCLERLNGMFAFAVWDGRENSLFLARDRMGQKPLYVAYEPNGDHPRSIAFASELSVLRRVDWVSTDTNYRSLADYLAWGYAAESRTFYKGAWQLDPGTSIVIVQGKVGPTHRYFPLWFEHGHTPATNPHLSARSTRDLVLQAVRRQLVSDVPLGCFLSGGIDSSVVAAAMKATGEKVISFSVGFDDERYDETKYASAVARHLGVEHHAFTVHPAAVEDLPKLACVFGEPFADSSALPTHYLSRETRRHVKVALSGDGGDELFGGYDRYRAMRLSERLNRMGVMARVATGAAKWMPGGHPKSLGGRLKRFLAAVDLPTADRYAAYTRFFAADLCRELIRPEAPGSDTTGVATGNRVRANQFKNLMRHGHDAVTAALAIDRMSYLPGDLLTKVDRASMLHGLEVRSPFMDHELVQFAAGLTTDQLLKGGPKRMLREAFADDLPAWVFKRKKMGFAVPIGEWFRGELRGMLRDHLFAADAFGRGHFNMKVVERLVDEHETQKVDHSQRLYALLMLELWWRTSR